MMKRYALGLLLPLMLLWCGGLSLAAQTLVTDTLGRVEGHIIDEDNRPMPGVTVKLMTARDSIVRNLAITDSLGRYQMARLPLSGYLMSYSMLGYQTGFVHFNLTANRPAVSVPRLQMERNDVMLNAAVVTASLPPVTVIDDTVAYNADAFQAPEGAMAEELIERIPGAEITDDGKIVINGKEYSRILVNGREFFGNDPQMALKNLPANIIRRVKTYDRKSAQTRLTGIDDGEEDNVIDLEIKPNMFKGWVGQASGALGNHDRYSTALNLNKFRKEQHLSIMGGMNNVNNPGFSERGRDAVNFSRGSRSGLTASKSTGINYSREKKDKYRISGNLRYGYSNAENKNGSHSETIYNDSNYRYGNNDSHSMRRRYEWSSNFTLEWKPDTLTNIHVRPNVSFSRTTSWTTGESTAQSWNGRRGSDTTDINHRLSGSHSRSEGSNASLSFGVSRRLSRKGRNVSFSSSVNYSDGSSDTYSRNLAQYFLQSSRNRKYNRYSDNDNHSMSYSVGATYSEPLSKVTHLQLRYSFNRRHARQDRFGREVEYAKVDTMALTENQVEWGTIPVDTALSNCIENNYSSHNVHLTMRHTTKKLNASYGVNLNPRHNETNYIFGPKMDKGLLTQDLMNWAPSLNLRYRFTKRTTLTLNYNGQSSEPNIDNLQEIIDKTNPQNIRYGNPGLKPSFHNNMRASFNSYGEKSHRSLVTDYYFSSERNNTSNMTLYESSTGVRVSKLMNVDGRWSMGGNINLNTPLDSLERLNLSTHSQVDYNDNTNYNSTPLTAEQLREAGISVDFQDIQASDIDLLQPYALRNHTHTLRLRQNMTLRYRKKKFLAGITGGVGYYKVENSIQMANRRETFDYTLRSNLQMDLPMNIQLSSTLHFTSRHGYSANIQKNIAIWDGQISKRFLKRNAGLLTFQIYDILHQRSTVTRNISNLTITDTRAEALRNYFMLGFQYRINTMVKGQGQQRLGRGSQTSLQSQSRTRNASAAQQRRPSATGNAR